MVSLSLLAVECVRPMWVAKRTRIGRSTIATCSRCFTSNGLWNLTGKNKLRMTLIFSSGSAAYARGSRRSHNFWPNCFASLLWLARISSLSMRIQLYCVSCRVSSTSTRMKMGALLLSRPATVLIIFDANLGGLPRLSRVTSLLPLCTSWAC